MYDADQTENKVHFVKWINDTFVPEDERSKFPGPDVTDDSRRFRRWCLRNITKKIHPDNFIILPIDKLCKKLLNEFENRGKLQEVRRVYDADLTYDKYAFIEYINEAFVPHSQR